MLEFVCLLGPTIVPCKPASGSDVDSAGQVDSKAEQLEMVYAKAKKKDSSFNYMNLLGSFVSSEKAPPAGEGKSNRRLKKHDTDDSVASASSLGSRALSFHSGTCEALGGQM